jgi:hypothetical protein
LMSLKKSLMSLKKSLMSLKKSLMPTYRNNKPQYQENCMLIFHKGPQSPIGVKTKLPINIRRLPQRASHKSWRVINACMSSY